MRRITYLSGAYPRRVSKENKLEKAFNLQSMTLNMIMFIPRVIILKQRPIASSHNRRDVSKTDQPMVESRLCIRHCVLKTITVPLNAGRVKPAIKTTCIKRLPAYKDHILQVLRGILSM